MAQAHNQQLTRESAHQALTLADYLLWKDEQAATEAQLVKAMSDLGIPLRKDENGEH